MLQNKNIIFQNVCTGAWEDICFDQVLSNASNTVDDTPQPCNTLISRPAVDVYISHLCKLHNKVNRYVFHRKNWL